MSISFQRAFGLHDDSLMLRARRAEVLATNLANADTPGYKARDFDFRAAMSQADRQMHVRELRRTHATHLGPAAVDGAGGPEMLYRNPLQPAVDGNTVDTQLEQAAAMENAVRYQASLTFLNGKLRGLLTALKGE